MPFCHSSLLADADISARFSPPRFDAFSDDVSFHIFPTPPQIFRIFFSQAATPCRRAGTVLRALRRGADTLICAAFFVTPPLRCRLF
jgi:hypothetical protein